MASEYRSGVRYTGLVDRIPAQSVLALAIVVLPIVAALGAASFRLPVWTAALSGAGFGAYCLLYPVSSVAQQLAGDSVPSFGPHSWLWSQR
jgi:hypothetical protein